MEKNIKKEILNDLKNCLGENVRKESSRYSALYKVNIKNINLLRKKYDLKFNKVFFEMFCFLSKNFKNKKEELSFFKKTKFLIRYSEELSFLNENNLNDFLQTYTNSNEYLIDKKMTLINKDCYFFNREISHPVKLINIVKSDDSHVPPYNSFYYLIRFFNDEKTKLFNRTIVIGNEEHSSHSLKFI